jgi:hypothetical protein
MGGFVGQKGCKCSSEKSCPALVGGAERALGIGQPQVDRNYALSVVPTGAFRGRVAAAASSNHSLSRTIKLTKTIKPNSIYMRFDLMASLPTMCATSWGRPAFRQTARANAHES